MMVWDDSGAGGVTVTVPDVTSLLNDLSRRLEAGQGFSVATLNLDHVVKLARDRTFLEAYKAQTHVTADGNPVVWLSRLARQNVSLVQGSDLVLPLAEMAAGRSVPLALVGSSQDTLETAVYRLAQKHPELDVVLCHAPAMGFDPEGDEAGQVIAAIEASGAGLCLLALGAPKQEIFAARAQKILPGVGFVSVGAGLDFISGRQIRAPRWVRAVAAEWLWRLLQNPRRLFARYAACFICLPGLVGRALKRRRRAGTQP